MKPLAKCPKCGKSDAYYFEMSGDVSFYIGLFGEGRDSEHHETTLPTRTPKYAFCSNCGEGIKLTLLRGDE